MDSSIRSFRDLNVYRLAVELQQDIFELSKSFDPEEKYSLTDQVRRSSRSIGANLAEAWHKRRYVAHFVSKLTDSDGENAETEHWIETAYLCGYLADRQKQALLAKCQRIGMMLGTMMSKAEQFCGESR